MFHYEFGNGYIDYKIGHIKERDIFYRHMHDNIEIHFIFRAKGTFRIDESTYEIHNRDLVIMPKHVYHYVKININEPYERIIINVPSNFFGGIVDDSFFSKPVFVNLASHNELIKVFENMIYFDGALKDEEDKKRMILLLINQIIIIFKNTTFDSGVSKSVNELTSKIIGYIDEHIYENLTVTKIADALYVSKSHLQNTFLASMKIGVKTYIIIKKMNIAHALLQEGKRSTTVALMLGYSTYSCFYKSYIKVFGVPPKDTK